MKGSIRTLAAFRLALTVTATLAASGVDPTFAPAYASLGMSRTYTGNTDEALRYLEKAVTYEDRKSVV